MTDNVKHRDAARSTEAPTTELQFIEPEEAQQVTNSPVPQPIAGPSGTYEPSRPNQPDELMLDKSERETDMLGKVYVEVKRCRKRRNEREQEKRRGKKPAASPSSDSTNDNATPPFYTH